MRRDPDDYSADPAWGTALLTLCLVGAPVFAALMGLWFGQAWWVVPALCLICLRFIVWLCS